MDLIDFGKTGLKVTPMGLGLAALGRPGYINLKHGEDLRDTSVEAMRVHAHKMLDLAWEHGIRHFDTARSYGRAEEFLSQWLEKRKVQPHEIIVSSKWGYTYSANWQVDAEQHEVKDHSLATLQRQWQKSRDLLGDYLKIYQIHSATLESGVLDDESVHAELAKLKSSGVRIGLTTSGPQQSATLKKALNIKYDGELLFDCVQTTWNLLERGAGPWLRRAHDQGLGIIIKEAVANGRLTSHNREENFSKRDPLFEKTVERMGTTQDGLALTAALAKKWTHVVLSGATTPDQLESNVKALSVQWDYEAETDLAPMVELSETYWQKRANLPWN